MRHGFTACGLVLLLASCSPPGPVIRATLASGKIVFQAFQSDGNLFFSSESPTPLRVDRVAVYGRDGATWVIERRRDTACRENATSTFPLTYGQVPQCFAERLRAAPLRPDILYRIGTSEGPFTEGFFRILQSVEEPKREAAYREAESWPAATNPNTAFPWEALRPELPPGDTNLLSANLVIETPPE